MNLPIQKTLLSIFAVICVLTVLLRGQTNSSSGWFWSPDISERARGLPLGVPHVVDTNGNFEFMDNSFTTHAYQDEAFRLMNQEATRAAQALHLEEDLPLTSSNAGGRISPFGMFFVQGMLGYVATTNYAYRFFKGGQLDHVEIGQLGEVQNYCWHQFVPENQLDTNAAYQLATQWLSAFSVDVKGLNRDCQLTLKSDPVFNKIGSGNAPIQRVFSPVYDIWWKSTNNWEPAASVELYLPDKLLMLMGVDDPKYNRRPPLVFTNLAALFPGQAMLTTNYPTTPIAVTLGAPPYSEVNFVTDSNQPEPTFHDLPLSRWIRTQSTLNSNNLSLSQLVTLKKAGDPDEWGEASVELPIPFDTLHYHTENPPFPDGSVDIGSLNTNGDFLPVTFSEDKRAPDGNTLVEWNINYESPGLHDLRARLLYEHNFDGDDFKLIGPPLHYYCSNACQFFEGSTIFSSEGANLYAKLREPVAKFRIKITDRHNRLINDISNSTTNGTIGLGWDLTGLDGQKYTNNSFDAYFYITYPDDTHTNPPVKAGFCKIGTSCDEN